MDGPWDGHTEWSKSDRQVSHITYMWNLKKKKWYKWTYLQNRNRVKDVESICWGDKLGDWAWHMHTTIYKIDNE